MISYYLKMGFRGLRQHGFYTWINVLGLAIGFLVAALILLYVVQEVRFDRIHPASDRVFRIAHHVEVNDQEIRTSLTPGPLASRLGDTFPGVELVCRLYHVGRPVANSQDIFFEESVLGIDESCLQMFTFRFLAGQADSALAQGENVVLTEQMATKYFGDGPALGRQLRIGSRAFTVTGVVEDMSSRSHLRYDFLVPLHTQISQQWVELWSPHIFHTYVRLQKGAEVADFEQRLDHLVSSELGPRFAEGLGKTFADLKASGNHFGYFVQPLEGIHLDSKLDFELQPNGDRNLVNLLMVVALLILLIAGVNYTNLTLARSSKRVLEVGLRKALGAERRQLIAQFLAESMVMMFTAAALALFLVALTWKKGARFIDPGVAKPFLADPQAWLGIGIVFLGLAFLAGLYPAFILSSFRPLGMLYYSKEDAGGRWLRRVVLAFQYCIAISLLTFVFTIHQQMRYLVSMDLGFRPEGLVAVMELGRLEERWRTFKQEALREPGVLAASATSSLPGLGGGLEGYLYPGTSTRQEDLVTTWVLEADADFVETAGIELVEGEDLKEVGTESQHVVLVSRMVLNRLGWTRGLRQIVTVGKVRAIIHGVFDDVYMESLHSPLQETIIRPLLRTPQALLVRLDEGSKSDVLARLKLIWKQLAPDQPFVTKIVSNELRALYQPERRLMHLIEGFSFAAVILTCLGIFGLSAFSAEQRRREIGIRKSLGASALSVVSLLSKEFLWLILVALITAFPLASYITRWWLRGFTSHTAVDWWVSPVMGIAILVLTLLVVAPQGLYAARSNPADSLRQI